MKRILSAALVLLMIITLLPISVFADDADIASGVFSKNEAISWKISSDYTLTISGEGEMPYECPWADYRTKIAAVKIEEGITFVRDMECLTNVKSVSLPNTLEGIGNRAFSESTGLKSIVIPDSVTDIAPGAFTECTALESVVLPKGLTSVQLACFENCTSLKSIVIPENVTDIVNGAFNGCKSLAYVALPAGLGRILPSAFGGCTALTRVYFAGTEEQWNAVNVYTEGNDSLIKAAKVFNSTGPSISVTAGNNATSGKITLSWNPVAGAAKYEVYRSGTKNGTYSKMLTTTNCTYTNTGASAGYTYYYKVKALDSAGKEIITSDIVSRTCDCAAPVVTSGNNATTGQVTLKWSAVTGADKYEIYRATSRNGEYVRMHTTTSTSYTNTSSKANNTYYYKVRALSSRTTAADSAFCSVIERTCDCAAPVVSTSNNAVTGKNVLTWKAVEGAAKYEVYRSSTKDGTYSKMLTTSGCTYTNTGATAGYTYYYKVKAISAKTQYADSAFSTVVNRTCDCAMMDVEVDYNNNGNLVFTWDKVSGATSYKVYRSGSQNGTYKLLTTTSSTSYTDTSASPGYYYFYKFVAVSSRSSYADSAAASGKAASGLAQPKNLSKEDSMQSYKLRWSAVKGADGYLVVYSTSTSTDELEIYDQITSGTTCLVNRYEGVNRSFYFRIIAYKCLSDGSYVLSNPSEYVKLSIN